MRSHLTCCLLTAFAPAVRRAGLPARPIMTIAPQPQALAPVALEALGLRADPSAPSAADAHDTHAREVLLGLEELNNKPLTPAFLELGLSGRWELVRSVPPLDIALDAVDGLIDSDDEEAEGFHVLHATSEATTLSPGMGHIASQLAWEWARQGVRGRFLVNCSYVLTEAGTLQLRRSSAELDVSADLDAAAAETLMQILKIKLPPSIADPHESVLSCAYLDHELLLTRCTGSRHQGTLSLWRRKAWAAAKGREGGGAS
jgi:hypothetical protein